MFSKHGMKLIFVPMDHTNNHSYLRDLIYITIFDFFLFYWMKIVTLKVTQESNWDASTSVQMLR